MRSIGLTLLIAIYLIAGDKGLSRAYSAEVLIKWFDISAKEALLHGDALYRKGQMLYRSDERKGIKYILVSGLKGNLQGAKEGLEWLIKNPDYEKKRALVILLAKQLHRNRHILGTYHLGNSYMNGYGVQRNFEVAIVLLTQVKRFCALKGDRQKRQYLGKDYDLRCRIGAVTLQKAITLKGVIVPSIERADDDRARKMIQDILEKKFNQ